MYGAILVFAHRHFLSGMTQKGRAKYNHTLILDVLGYQNVTLSFHQVKTHCEGVKVLRRKHGEHPNWTMPRSMPVNNKVAMP